jgi:DNA-directed RNA polymerase specialized sigma24 family protein
VTPHTAAMACVAAALVGMADAEDAAQEALLRAWQNWSSLRDGGAAHTWLLRITVNVCHNWQSGHFGTTRRNESLDRVSHQNTPDHIRDVP